MSMLVQLSDPHIRAPGCVAFGRVDTAAYLQRAVASVLALAPRPDAVVITGDLTESGAEVEYRHLAELLEPLPMPVYLMPGNHEFAPASINDRWPADAMPPRAARPGNAPPPAVA